MTIICTRPFDIDSTGILLSVLNKYQKATLRRLEARSHILANSKKYDMWHISEPIYILGIAI